MTKKKIQCTNYSIWFIFILAFMSIYIYSVGEDHQQDVTINLPQICAPNIASNGTRITYDGHLLAVGILTIESNLDLRMAQRKTWLNNDKIFHKFLVDKNSDFWDAEQAQYGDVLVLNSTFTKKAEGFGEKLYKWMKYAKDTYPKGTIIAKSDDDFYGCNELYQHLQVQYDDKMYFGWWHSPIDIKNIGRKSHIDEQFVAIGPGLANDILQKPWCHPKVHGKNCTEKNKDVNFDADYGGVSVGIWISHLKEVTPVVKNPVMVHYGGKQKDYGGLKITKFCGTWISHHKSDPDKMLYAEFVDQTNDSSGSATSGKLYKAKITRKATNQQVIHIKDKPTIEKRTCKTWAVVTTIFEKTTAVEEILNEKDRCLIIVADLKSKSQKTYWKSMDLKRVVYLTPNDQMKIFPNFAGTLPWNSFARKNVGYLYAISAGAEVIWDFDDDNYNTVDLDEVKKGNVTKPIGLTFPAINPYPYFGADQAWPRGFPIELIREKKTFEFETESRKIDMDRVGIIQSLANHDPDVDGMFRLTRETPFDFKENDPLLIPSGVFVPFNAQATFWFKRAFLLMYLPTTVHGRVADIWRSYITKYFLEDLNLDLIFTKAYVKQLRNAHDYLADFQSESDLYLKSHELVKFLKSKKKRKELSFEDQLIELYDNLYEIGIVEKDDLHRIRLWTRNLSDRI